ncbi:hypothetical protein [Crocosphaera sp.]|uniref:hypothetical protein n=1 Tax=Crocosphaera sp. TaxID=2729996 RepID=UPI00262655A3|nr:hypothetical protein [Crocosphaera sp.]MDJ0579376.1 hypothetical protein [Crocosphaera sp.]
MKTLILAVLILVGISPLARAQWGIVFDSHRSLSSAQYERRQIRNRPNNVIDINIYRRRNRYNLLMEFRSEEQANQAVEDPMFNNSSAYVVDIPIWCSLLEDMGEFNKCD